MFNSSRVQSHLGFSIVDLSLPGYLYSKAGSSVCAYLRHASLRMAMGAESLADCAQDDGWQQSFCFDFSAQAVGVQQVRFCCYNTIVKTRDITILAEQVEKDFLPFVRRPSRYIGGEINQVRKDLSDVKVRVALCFPDIYEVGMSHTGTAILYHCLNEQEEVAAERVFCPWPDAAEVMREKNVPLFTLESKAAVKDFDVIGFSLTSELCYTNVLEMLELAGVGLRSAETAARCAYREESSRRGEQEPLVIAGGGMANCCEPIAEFIDLFVLGDGEEAAVKLAELVKDSKEKGLGKEEMLRAAAERFEWAYVPRFYRFEYEGGKIKSFRPIVSGLRVRFENAVVRDFENAAVPLRPIVPYAQAVHERVSVEIMRGCPGRCRFCQASFCRRPVRYRSVERIFDIARQTYRNTGFETVSLLSLSSAEYPKLEELVSRLDGYFRDRYVGLSLPSLRVDRQLKLLPELVKSVRKSGLTVAVEAASERLREVINKPLKDSDLFAAVESAYLSGWKKLKLYFMVGLPGESEEDIKRIVELCDELSGLGRKVAGKAGKLNITVSWLVPKPHTPFGRLGQKPREWFERARKIILSEKRKLGARGLQFKFHRIERSVLEAAMARGDRRLCRVIEQAWRNGARFDLWDEHFDYGTWQECFEKAGMDADSLAQKQFGSDEIRPWEHLGGPGKEYLLRQFP